MSEVDPRLRVLAALLAQGRTVHLTCGVLTLGAWGLGGGALALSCAVGVVWAGETWLAVRVGVDATLFDALAAGTAPEALDQGLVGLGLVAEGSPRPLDARIDGARRLWRGQLALASVQGVLVVVALLLRGLS